MVCRDRDRCATSWPTTWRCAARWVTGWPARRSCSTSSSTTSTTPASPGSRWRWRWTGRGCQPTAASNWWAYRLSAVRGFATYLHAIDPVHEVPAADLLPQRPLRASPYLYSDADIAALIAATRALRTPLRQATFATLIGLLAVTGIRVGEAIALDRGDVDLASGRLVVRHGKFGKARELTLHPTTVAALRRYQRLRDRSAPATGTAALLRLHGRNPAALLQRPQRPSTGWSIWPGSRRGQRRAGPASTTCGTPSRSTRCSTPTPPARTGRPG